MISNKSVVNDSNITQQEYYREQCVNKNLTIGSQLRQKIFSNAIE